MPQSIARIFAGPEVASAAVKDLQEHGFRAEAIQGGLQPNQRAAEFENARDPDEMVPPAESETDAIIRAGVPRGQAKIFADHLKHGQTLVVVVDPPFGSALAATEILESHGPIAIDLPEAEVAYVARKWDWTSPTPLSSWLGWRVLSDDPTPLSTWLKQPVLKTDPVPSRTLEKIRQQSTDAAPLSRKLGMRVLSDNPAPLSAKLGWGILSSEAAPLSEKLGWRTHSDNPTPLSTKLGWRVLSDNPTPLSSALGWKVLSRE